MSARANGAAALDALMEQLVDVVVDRVIERLEAAPPRLLGPAEFAARAGISRSNLYVLMATGRVRSTRVGRRRLIAETELRRLLEGVDR
ncbi:MAG TPA: helix-turn-helix domain-containing protein [Candidatus Binatia bacterium]|nr:helix-turn-helix domain-containing protein [Candidatus Binatia bacterium]